MNLKLVARSATFFDAMRLNPSRMRGTKRHLRAEALADVVELLVRLHTFTLGEASSKRRQK
jgi:hypothetical protein